MPGPQVGQRRAQGRGLRFWGPRPGAEPGAFGNVVSIKIKKKNADLWPKRRQMCPMGLYRRSTQPSRCIYNIYITYINRKKKVSNKKKKKTKQKVPLAEPMHLASFGSLSPHNALLPVHVK